MFESVDISYIYRFVLQECNYDSQQDQTQLLIKTVQNRRNRIANGMKQVSQHGCKIVCKTYFLLVPGGVYDVSLYRVCTKAALQSCHCAVPFC